MLNTAAVSKYDAGVAAMKRGDCVAAKTLFKEAIAMDPHDRAERVGMYTTEYYPNAKLKEAETKCPSQTAIVKTEPPPVPPAPPPQVPKPVEPPRPPEPSKPEVKGPDKEVRVPEPVRPIEPEKPKPEFVNHKVYAGETWESIAVWYLGDPNRGRELARRNPNLPQTLKGGDLVKIPKELAIAHNWQPNHSTAPKEPEPPPQVQPSTPQVPANPPPQAAKPPRIEGMDGVFGPK